MSEFIARPSHGVAWITGASSGIGRALCLELARRGWTIAATARRAGELADLAASVRAVSGRVLPFPADVTDAAALAATVAQIENEVGPVALAVLCAGVFREVTGAALEGEAFRECLDVNVGGVVNALVPLVPAMRARGRGQIALMASAAARTGWPTTAAYGAANAAVVTMAEALRLDLAPAGIHVTVVAPGFVDTPLSRRTSLPKPGLMSVDEAAERIVEGLGRPGFEIAFPRRLTWPLKLLNLVPYRLYFPLLNRLARRGPVMVTGARRR